ncbi:MAG TPA: hypothetical protein VJT73_09945 [Polyangiaceae bacterium]|nr:hypothetical protein [Polyangiaceae bacterium]
MDRNARAIHTGGVQRTIVTHVDVERLELRAHDAERRLAAEMRRNPTLARLWTEVVEADAAVLEARRQLREIGG